MKNIQQMMVKIIVAFTILLGVATFSPALSEAAPNRMKESVSYESNSYETVETTRRNVTSIEFTNKSYAYRGLVKGIVHIGHKYDSTNVTNPSAVKFVRTQSNYSETVIKKSKFTGKITSMKTTVYLDGPTFNKTIAKYRKKFNKKPKMSYIKSAR